MSGRNRHLQLLNVGGGWRREGGLVRLQTIAFVDALMHPNRPPSPESGARKKFEIIGNSLEEASKPPPTEVERTVKKASF